ncbi:MAG: hypothetical protein D6729_15645 [Deltaproteobacteria bacterium]|nr:MAG: hypothetical protein D6729_15645 [Deltaproteobacteria bacterium]
MVVSVELDFVDALRGTEIRVRVPGGRRCKACEGRGVAAGSEEQACPECGGSGRRQAVEGPMRIVATCPACGGTGTKAEPCPVCEGSGVEPGDREVTVRIPPGADTGDRLRVPGKGLPGRGRGPDGDLYVEVRVRPHRFFERDGLDLRLRLPVTLEEAYLGTKVEIPTPDGPVTLKIPPRSQPRRKLRLKEKGVRRGGKRGHLYVELDVRLPDREDPEVAEAIRVTTKGYSRPVREEITL